MKRWKKVTLTVLLGIGIVAVGGKLAFDYVADKMMKKIVSEVSQDPDVERVLKDKEIQQKLEKLQNDPSLQKQVQDLAKKAQGAAVEVSEKVKETAEAAAKQANANEQKQGNTNSKSKNADAGGVHFKNTSQAAQYAMKRFSMSEINYYRGMAEGGLTPQEKKEIKAVVLSRFSPEEIQAFIEVARQ